MYAKGTGNTAGMVLLSHWDQNIFKITFKLSCLYDISPLVNYQSFIKVKFEEISCKGAAKGIYARTYLQPHYSNGVFGNVYLSAGQH